MLTRSRMSPLVTVALAALLLIAACGRGPGATGNTTGASSANPPNHTLRDAQLVTPQFGWALTASGLAVTSDSGAAWQKIGPTTTDRVVGIYFANPQQGWIATVNAAPAPTMASTAMTVYRTVDGGSTWNPSVLTAHPVGGVPIDRAVFDFASGTQGWMLLDDSSDANVSRGEVFTTTDGGATWRGGAATAFGNLRALTKSDAYITSRDLILVSHDSGATWSHAAVAASAIPTNDYPLALPAVRVHGAPNIAPVLLMQRSAPTVEGVAFLQSSNNGDTWQLAGSTATDRPEAGIAEVASVLSADAWVVAMPTASGGLSVAATSNRGRSWSRHSLTAVDGNGVAEVDFASAARGWAIVTKSGCAAPKAQCSVSSTLFATRDGAASWVALSPP